MIEYFYQYARGISSLNGSISAHQIQESPHRPFAIQLLEKLDELNLLNDRHTKNLVIKATLTDY